MALNLPDNADTIVQQSRTDVQRELNSVANATQANAFLKASWLGAIVTSAANRVFDYYLQLREAVRLNFPDTTEGEFLDRWATIYGTARQPATGASGNVVATGTATTLIPTGTVYQSSEGLSYTSTADATITAQSESVTSLTRSGSTVTATTSADHGLATGVDVTIAGAVETDYNGTFAVTVTGLDTFTYTIAGTPTSPATGTVTADHTTAAVPLQADDFGAQTNQAAGTTLTLASPIAGVDNDAVVDYGELGGGVDQEADDDLRARFLDRVQNPVAHFNVADITRVAKGVAGVTRVFVEENTPDVGKVTVYFLRDNDADPIPSASEVAAVEADVLAIKPANTPDAYVVVSAPAAVPTAFTFTALTPNTSTMQAAISASLAQFFAERVTVGVDVDEDLYRAAIAGTVDTVTGDTVDTFTLSAPSGDLTIAAGEIATLGTVTYP